MLTRFSFLLVCYAVVVFARTIKHNTKNVIAKVALSNNLSKTFLWQKLKKTKQNPLWTKRHVEKWLISTQVSHVLEERENSFHSSFFPRTPNKFLNSYCFFLSPLQKSWQPPRRPPLPPRPPPRPHRTMTMMTTPKTWLRPWSWTLHRIWQGVRYL